MVLKGLLLANLGSVTFEFHQPHSVLVTYGSFAGAKIHMQKVQVDWNEFFKFLGKIFQRATICLWGVSLTCPTHPSAVVAK